MTAPDVIEETLLNNDEFFSLIPHLELEELLMIQINKDGAWDFLFKASFDKTNELKTLTCVACDELLDYKKFSIHLKQNSHELAMKNIKQFYHPYYTNNDDEEKNENDADAAAALENDKENNKEQANSSPCSDSITISKSKLIAESIRKFQGDLKLDSFKDPLLKTVLTKDVMNPEDFLVEVKLPLDDLLNLEFCVEKDKWFRMVTVNKIAHTKFYCALCSKFCFGIITVEDHLKGYTHKKAQIGCIGIRSSRYKDLTKNCIYGYGEEFAIKTKRQLTKSLVNKNDEVKEENDDEIKQEQIDNPNEETKPTLAADIAEKVKNIKEKMHSQSKDNVEGLIGVEYVIKILKTPTDKYPRYECCLCETVLNENRMQGHLTGYNHRLKYCELHYPDTIEKFKDLIGHCKYMDYFNAMNYALSKIASAIEQHHGRSTPYVVSSTTFTKMRSELIAELYSYPNACQQHGPSFINVIEKQEIKSVASGQTDYVVQNNNHARFVESPEDKMYLRVYRKCHDPKLRNEENFVATRKRKRSKSPPSKTKYAKSMSRSQPPVSSKQYSQKSAKTVNRSPHYDDEVTVTISEIERMYREYRKNPESHPLYDEEWNDFWRQRKEQLISQGIDHRSYNYQPEWVKYFKTRLEELFEKELYDSRMEVRDRYSNYENKSVTINNLSIKSKNVHGEHPYSHSTRSNHLEETKDVTDGKPTVIHVLRLLTALEEYLGSLGSKVMDLLSKALIFEKNCSNSIELEQKILTYENCTLLETAVEKLKGILFAGLLDDSKIQGFKRIIEYTSDLLKYADRMGWRNLQSQFSNRNDKPEYRKNTNDASQNIKINPNQKTLSDTLMDLLAMQKNNNESILPVNNNSMKPYSNERREIPNSEVGQYFMNTQPKNSYWQTMGSNTSVFLNKPQFMERNLNGSSMGNHTNNLNKAYNQPPMAYNQPAMAYNHPAMFPSMQMTGNRSNYNYNQTGGVNNFH
uniref:Uncharacterized protein CG7065 n=1 Tax=Ceratitis capitata TaxID=7213 RepID=W8B1G1_CERCA